MDIEKIRDRLLSATLAHVPFDGWTGRAMRAGAADAGLDASALLNAFPGGPAEMLEVFSIETDRRMLAELEKRDLAALKVRERIATAVRTRLELLSSHREAVRRALSVLALPHNAALGLKLLYRTVDAIWYAAGDTSTDYNFYTKRLLLAGVYSSTVLFWVNDKSEDCVETWAFLERRIDEVLTLGGTIRRTVGGLLDLPESILRGGARRRARPR